MQQALRDRITSSLKTTLQQIERRYPNAVPLKALFEDVARALLGEQPFDDALCNRIKNETAYELQWFISGLFEWVWNDGGSKEQAWPINSPVVRAIIQRKNYSDRQRDPLSYQVSHYIYQALVMDRTIDRKSFLNFLYQQGFTDKDIAVICAGVGNSFYVSFRFLKDEERQKRILTPFGEFIIPLLKPEGGFLGMGKSPGLAKPISEKIFSTSHNDSDRRDWLNILLDHYPEAIDDYKPFIVYEQYSRIAINVLAILLMIERKVPRYDDIILSLLEKGTLREDDRFLILLRLTESAQGKHRQKFIDAVEGYFGKFLESGLKYFYEVRINRVPLTEVYTDFLFRENPDSASKRVERYFTESKFIAHTYFNYAHQKFGSHALPWLIEVLKKNPADVPLSDSGVYFESLFGVLKNFDLRPYRETLLNFATNLATKKSRILACEALAQEGNEMIPEAEKLLTGKTVDLRVTGALILTAIGTAETEILLNGAVDNEPNDDTRDIMLEALAEKRFKDGLTFEQVEQTIAFAEQRKKLNKWSEKWIDETQLPKLFWTNSKPLTQQDIRFLIYRMKRATGLNSDIEVRHVLPYISRDSSQAFAKAMLTAFQNSDADTKLKYYLTLAALLGDDEMMHNLNTLFKKCITDKRIKMAEHVVGALAMVGTNKALRLVEVIYRKFAAKKPMVSQAAKAALDAAATELNITLDELADRIIPDFGFEGIHKNFTVEGNEYRAFINAEFKLNYFTDDNKVRKSLPTNTSKELKAEFKEIEKEINDVVKSQSGRLEKYMVEERRWSAENWKTFFFDHPIMFVYGLKLLWGVFDKNGKLCNAFYCSEDTSLYTVNDDEVEISDDQFIGILHPIYLDADQLAAWKDKVYALSLVTVFPILDRPVFTVDDHERESNTTLKYNTQDIPKGADFVNTFLVKQNWRKTTADGGRSEFTKAFKDGMITAVADVDGPTAWYQGGNTPATMHDIRFIGKNWQDKIHLKDIPVVFYSEVVADIHQMINA